MAMGARRQARRGLVAACAAVWLVAAAAGQASHSTLFVANNGNLEGSVTSLRIGAGGSLTFVDKFVTGSRPNSQEYDAGTNATAVAPSPNGRYLVVTHATSSNTVEQITMLEVAANGTLSLVGEFTTPDSPLDAVWLDDLHFAVTRSRVSAANEVIVYRFEPNVPRIVETDRAGTGSFNTALALHPSGTLLFAQDSLGFVLRWFAVSSGGHIAPVSSITTNGVYPLAPCITHSGEYLYANGGTSGGGDKVLGFEIFLSSGLVLELEASPFTSDGDSPKVCAVSEDDAYLFVGHGTDATCRSFAINPANGELSSTGSMFDVGLQGSLGDLAILGNYLFITDNTTAIDGQMGVYSFTIGENGSMTPNGPLVSTQGTAPNQMATWFVEETLLTADCNCDGVVNNFDIDPFVLAVTNADGYAAAFPNCDLLTADVNGDGLVNNFDVDPFVVCVVNGGCP